MIAHALTACIIAASNMYSVPEEVIIGILRTEGGRVGQAVQNTNNTYDLGLMQINTIWIPELATNWQMSETDTANLVKDEPCVNIQVGAWILKQKINQTGSLEKGIAFYHSGTKELGDKYKAKVLAAIVQDNRNQQSNRKEINGNNQYLPANEG